MPGQLSATADSLVAGVRCRAKLRQKNGAARGVAGGRTTVQTRAVDGHFGQWRHAARACGRCAAVALTLVLALLCGASPLLAAELRFRDPPAAAAPAFGPLALSQAEREFIESLPEVRVAVPRPGERPYLVIGADGEVSGIHADLLAALGRAFGLKLRAVEMPDWPSALRAARERQVDLLMSVGVSAERLEFLEFTLGATPAPAALFQRRGANPPDPARARYAIETDYVAQDVLRRQSPRATILSVPSTLDALAAVRDGRADYYLGSLLATADLLSRQPVEGIEIARVVTYGSGHYHFAVRKDWPVLAGILNKGIQTLRSVPSAELSAALGALPPGVRVAAPLPLATHEAVLLAQRPVWKLGAVRGLAMLNDVDADLRHSGIASEYAAHVAARLGVSFQVVPFDSVGSMLDALRAGAIDVVPFLTRTPEREREFTFSKPYVEMPYMLIARRDAPLYWDLDSLRGRRLALAPQHPLRPLLAERWPDIRVVDARDGNAAMDMVARDEADAAVEVKLFANLRLNGDGAGTLRSVASLDALPAQFHFAAAARGPGAALMPLVDRVLAEIPSDERERMLRRWVATDLVPPFPWQRYLPVALAVAAGLLALGLATAWWMRRLSREVTARRRSERLLSDIAASVPGVAFRYVLNPDGTVRHHYVSPGARALLGIELDPRRTVLDAIAPRLRPEHREAALAAQAHSLATGEPFKVTGAYAHPDGRERWLMAEAVRGTSGRGLPIWTGYIVDVTTERDLQQRLAREAESRNLMLASASHELRAPTHTLSLALQSLTEGHLPPAQRESLRIARDAARTLAQLLNDVLDAARFENEHMRLRPRDFDLPALLAETAGAWRAAAHSKGLRFEADFAPDLPRVVRLDPLRLKQILTNLLSNACKHTPRGTVSLAARRAVDAAGRERLAFTVADTGEGIAAHRLPNLFTPYAAAADDPVPAEGSTGLGLAICKRLVDLMGGEITVESAPGAGTRMHVSLPVPAVSARPNGHATDGAVGAVLVCDDDPTSRTLMVHMLRRAGFDAAEATEGHEALERWRRGDVRAIVTDLDMPGLPGAELIRRVRAEEAGNGAHTAVVVCSGSMAPAESPARDGAALHDAYLVKPVEMAVLTRTLEGLGVRRGNAA